MKNITNKIKFKKVTVPTDFKQRLDEVEYEEDETQFLISKIREYIVNDYPLDVLINNWRKIKQLGRDSSSLHSYITRYGENLGKAKFEQKNSASVSYKEDYIKRYGCEETANKILSSRGASLENYINRYGEELGTIKWQEYLSKRHATYKINKAKGKYASRNLAWFQNKYGEQKGYEVWDKKRKKQSYKVSKQYYIDTYGEELGNIKCRNTKARDLDFFISKYGIDQGTEKYYSMIKKSMTKLKSRKSYSKWSIEICEILKNTIDDIFYYGDNEMIWCLPEEYQLLLKQRIISPDLFYRGKVIEFQGDLFHGNPNLFEETDTPHPFKELTVAELREKDIHRINYYHSKGYEVLEIWEHDYKINAEEVIKQCLTFLK